MSEKRLEELLYQNGVYIDTTTGSSMWPMLRHHRDAVTVVPLQGEVKPYDVVLFRRKERLVLHRVIKRVSNRYFIRGDHCRNGEWVEKSQLLGILSAFTRKGKFYTVKSPGYAVYSRLIVWLHPILCLAARGRNWWKKRKNPC